MASRNPWITRVVVGLIVLAVSVVTFTQRADAGQQTRHKPMPVSTKFEGKSGIRITRVSVVGDGGLVDVRFIVLDPQKAHAYVGDSFNGQGKDARNVAAPRMRSNARRAVLKDTASMHQHADYVAGQSYYLLYLNPAGAIKPGDTLDLEGSSVKENFASLPVD